VFKLNFRLKAPLLAKAAGLLLALSTLGACTTPEVCASLGSCGGDILAGQKSKTWQVGAVCANEVAAAPSIPSLVHQAPTLAGEVSPKRTQVNWCSEMVLDATKQIKIIQPWFPALPVQSGQITYDDHGGLNATFNYFGPQEADFAAECFQSQGYGIVPEGTQSGPNTLTCSEFTPILLKGLSTQPNIMNFRCGNNGSGGCVCLYDLLLITSVVGKYVVDGSVINHYDTTSNSPVSAADFCVNGNELDLSGHRRTFLFNQPAMRSLVLSSN